MLNQRRQYQDNELEQYDLIYRELVKLYGNISNYLSIPEYADDTAADADTDLKSGRFYTTTGSRAVYVKP